MTEERIMNLYEHSKRTPLELKAERYFYPDRNTCLSARRIADPRECNQ
jgi:hypothetical protein